MTLMFALILKELTKHNIDAFIFAISDPHSNEYIGPSDEILKEVTKFTGSNGMVVIGKEGSYLLTDSRYYIQAEQELKLATNNIKLVKDTGEFYRIIKEHFTRVGVDRRVFSHEGMKMMKEKLGGVEIVGIEDFVDSVWEDRPAKQFNRVIDLEEFKILDYLEKDLIDELGYEKVKIDENTNVTGTKRSDKIERIRKGMEDNDLFVVTALDEIGWIFNLRGSDIEYNPVFYSYALISKDDAILFSGTEINLDETKSINYFDFEEKISRVREQKIMMSERVNSFVYDILFENENKITFSSVISEMKSIKNGVEVIGFRFAHIFDAISLCKLFEWMQDSLTGKNESEDGFINNSLNQGDNSDFMVNGKNTSNPDLKDYDNDELPTKRVKRGTAEQIYYKEDAKKSELSEIDITNKLVDLKKDTKGYFSPSFETISAFAENGAIIHHKGGSKIVGTDNLFLIDSGTQYFFGTTDVTRTLCFGTPTDQQREDFTKVLKGQINAMSLVINKNYNASILDALTRIPHWENLTDFGHSTGHGVGHFLNVHESPPNISTNGGKLKENMIFSLEPGLYKENEYGIRIEDLVVSMMVDENYIRMENLTLAPLQLKMIDERILGDKRINYINNYNERVRGILGKFLKDGDLGYKFMVENTEMIGKEK